MKESIWHRKMTKRYAAAIARRKAIYEELHPETKAGLAGGRPRKTSENFSEVPDGFAEATAKATGKTSRSIRTAAARGKASISTPLSRDVPSMAFRSLPSARLRRCRQRSARRSLRGQPSGPERRSLRQRTRSEHLMAATRPNECQRVSRIEAKFFAE